jgi:hypothetical protein
MAGEQQRDPALGEIEEAYRAGKLVLVVGAGLSTAAKLPSPARLVELVAAYTTEREEAAAKAEKRPVDAPMLAEIADLIEKAKRIDALSACKLALGSPDFCTFVERQINDVSVDLDELPPLAFAIAALRPSLRAVLTTNLDRLLDRAFVGAWQEFSRATGDIAQRKQFILKLHGALGDRATWVLTRDEHERALHLDRHLQTALGALFNACTLLFVGFDIAGEDFDQLLGRVTACAGTQPPRHFALVPDGMVGSYGKSRLGDTGVRLVHYADSRQRSARAGADPECGGRRCGAGAPIEAGDGGSHGVPVPWPRVLRSGSSIDVLRSGDGGLGGRAATW